MKGSDNILGRGEKNPGKKKKKRSGGCCGSIPEFSPSPLKYV
jgi:hypothetical protein